MTPGGEEPSTSNIEHGVASDATSWRSECARPCETTCFIIVHTYIHRHTFQEYITSGGICTRTRHRQHDRSQELREKQQKKRRFFVAPPTQATHAAFDAIRPLSIGVAELVDQERLECVPERGDRAQPSPHCSARSPAARKNKKKTPSGLLSFFLSAGEKRPCGGGDIRNIVQKRHDMLQRGYENGTLVDTYRVRGCGRQ